jgi:23S rRNA (cytosine1962-C5)-methyltransferase
VKAGHPWVYRSDLQQRETPRAALVPLVDSKGRFVATAISSSTSQIALRVISDQPLDETELLPFIRQRIRAARDYRERVYPNREAFRIVFSESDGLPGVVADKYRDVISIQLLTQIMARDDVRNSIIDELHTQFPACSIVERSDARIRELESLEPLESHIVLGDKSRTEFDLNGLTFYFDALAGQKTGSFLDQQENYAAAAEYARGECLDVFTYHGGFALHMARKCERVIGVDVSRAALEIAESNEIRNRSKLACKEIEWLEADAFELLKDFSDPRGGRRFDTIVLDPPAFAKTKRALEGAVRGYKEINLRALKMLRPGGTLVTNSCSFHMSTGDFAQMISAAAADAKRTVTILERRSAAKDHPVVATIPESDYLKCFICHVQ